MDNWNEIRTAAHVARLGTISAAAAALGVHRATVNRHIDILETELGGKLFQRHARGFTPTELGLELLRIADATDEQFSQLQRISNKQITTLTGDLIITSLDVFAPFMLPLMAEFRVQHPQVRTKFLHTGDVMKLEYGKAHIAFRAGAEPKDLDNVVQLFQKLEMGLYATQDYVAQFGKPNSIEDFTNHHFIGPIDDAARAPTSRWIKKHVPEHAIAFASNQMRINADAVLAGNGIGFLPLLEVKDYTHLVEIMPSLPEWTTQFWMVTHVDLHRSPKVQAFIEILKARNKKV